MARVAGLRAVISDLKAHRQKKKRGLAVGLVRGGLFLQRASQEIVPIEFGVLKNSAFTRPTSIGELLAQAKVNGRMEVRVGYTAAYAIYVHENMEAQHAEGKVAKFLERPAREKQQEIRNIIKQAVDEA